MNNLKLPTDNLYKFIAIFGLVLVIAAQIEHALLQSIYIKTKHDLLTNFSYIKAGNEVTKLELDVFIKRIDQLESQLGSTITEQQKIDLATEFLTLHEFAQQSVADSEAWQQDVLEMERLEQELAEKARGVFFNVGWLLIVIGFTLWWYKVQRLEDEILSQKALGARDASKSDLSE